MSGERDQGGSEVFNITKGLLSMAFGEDAADEFDREYRERIGDPGRSADVSFFSGVGIAERVLAQREEVRATEREAVDGENTVPSVRVNEVSAGPDAPTTAIAVICSDPDAEFSLSSNRRSLELYSPKHDYTDPIRVPFEDAVLRVSDTNDVAEATVIDATTLPGPDFPAERDPSETHPTEPDEPGSGVTNREGGKWYANGEPGDADE